MAKQVKKINKMTKVGKKINNIIRKFIRKVKKFIHQAKKVNKIFLISKEFSASALEGFQRSG